MNQPVLKKISFAAGESQIYRNISSPYTKSKYSLKIYISQLLMIITKSKSPAHLEIKKSELFNNFFSNVLNVEGQMSLDPVYKKKKLIFIKLSEDEIKEAISNLDADKICGPDNFCNSFLKKLLNLSKTLLLVFQA